MVRAADFAVVGRRQRRPVVAAAEGHDRGDQGGDRLEHDAGEDQRQPGHRRRCDQEQQEGPLARPLDAGEGDRDRLLDQDAPVDELEDRGEAVERVADAAVGHDERPRLPGQHRVDGRVVVGEPRFRSRHRLHVGGRGKGDQAALVVDDGDVPPGLTHGGALDRLLAFAKFPDGQERVQMLQRHHRDDSATERPIIVVVDALGEANDVLTAGRVEDRLAEGHAERVGAGDGGVLREIGERQAVGSEQFLALRVDDGDVDETRELVDYVVQSCLRGGGVEAESAYLEGVLEDAHRGHLAGEKELDLLFLCLGGAEGAGEEGGLQFLFLGRDQEDGQDEGNDEEGGGDGEADPAAGRGHRQRRQSPHVPQGRGAGAERQHQVGDRPEQHPGPHETERGGDEEERQQPVADPDRQSPPRRRGEGREQESAAEEHEAERVEHVARPKTVVGGAAVGVDRHRQHQQPGRQGDRLRHQRGEVEAAKETAPRQTGREAGQQGGQADGRQRHDPEEEGPVPVRRVDLTEREKDLRQQDEGGQPEAAENEGGVADRQPADPEQRPAGDHHRRARHQGVADPVLEEMLRQPVGHQQDRDAGQQLKEPERQQDAVRGVAGRQARRLRSWRPGGDRRQRAGTRLPRGSGDRGGWRRLRLWRPLAGLPLAFRRRGGGGPGRSSPAERGGSARGRAGRARRRRSLAGMVSTVSVRGRQGRGPFWPLHVRAVSFPRSVQKTSRSGPSAAPRGYRARGRRLRLLPLIGPSAGNAHPARRSRRRLDRPPTGDDCSPRSILAAAQAGHN